MKRIVALLVSVAFAASANANLTTELHYDRPANRFEEALPLGNGHLGALVYGGVADDQICLNEASLWGGCAITDNNPVEGGPQLLALVRQALDNEEWTKGRDLVMGLQGHNINSFLPMGSLNLRQSFGPKELSYDGYTRSLDLDSAVAKTSFVVGGVKYSREYFVSHPDKVMVIHLTASTKSLEVAIDGSSCWEGCSVKSVSDREFVVSGQLGWYQSPNWTEPFSQWVTGPNGEKGMRYQFRVKVIKCDGIVYSGTGLHVSKASDVVVLVSAATSFNGFDKRPDTEGRDEVAIASSVLQNAEKKPFEELKSEHIADYQPLFKAVSLTLGNNGKDSLPTNQRLSEYSSGAEDPALEALYFQFGRYLMISCSREDSEVPSNLQGLWCIDRHPAWGSDIHTNINVQMNYWPAEPLALSNMTLPLLKFIGNCSVNGAEVVKNMYGMKGWTVHHNSDIWAAANPVGEKQGNPQWANWVMGGGWLSSHLYEHYLFTGDKSYLVSEAYPLMKGAAEFLMDWLIEKDGKYVTSPSTSPENSFLDEKGEVGCVTIGSAMDLEICWDLFNNLIEASERLGVDPDLRKRWIHYRDNLHPLQIGAKGNLVEWYKDWEDTEVHHRHVSHLFGLYPGRQISPLTTPALAEASRKTLELRGDGGTGWSKAWKICFWARLLDGDHAYKMYRELLSKSTLPNLFDTHPPFQIDGNFGSIAGISEMLLQSQNDELHILPALPSSWSEGSVEGLHGRGAFVVDITWHSAALSEAKVKAIADGEKSSLRKCVLRTSSPVRIFRNGRAVRISSRRDGAYYLTSFSAAVGSEYSIQPR